MLFSIDVESDGPCPGLYSMISFGVVMVDMDLNKTFHGKVRPLPGAQRDEAAANISGISLVEHMSYPDAADVFVEFDKWLTKHNRDGKPVMVSDNPAFDWQFMNYYAHMTLGKNPLGFSARRIGDFYAGLRKDFFAASAWKKSRKTAHDHNPVNDAMGNAEALLQMSKTYGIKLPGM